MIPLNLVALITPALLPVILLFGSPKEGVFMTFTPSARNSKADSRERQFEALEQRHVKPVETRPTDCDTSSLPIWQGSSLTQQDGIAPAGAGVVILPQ